MDNVQKHNICVRMIEEWWIDKYFEGNSCSLIMVLSQHFPGGSEENYKSSVSRIASVFAKIWNEYLPHANLETATSASD
jgi:hypothetical protein